jgi:mRNA interferase RelE/StbE
VAYAIQTTAAADKDFAALPRDVLARVDHAVLALADEPRPHGVVKLKGTKGDRWRVRVGVYRVLYAIDDRRKIVEIARVLHRREAYRDL